MDADGWSTGVVRRGLAFLVALALAGCSGADEPIATASAGATVTAAAPTGATLTGPAVSCAHDLGGTAPSGDRHRLVLDAVAVPTATLVPNETGEPGWLFAKQGLVVRAGVPASVSVAPEAADRVRIRWGSPGPEGTAIHVPACPSGSGWLAFAGGYLVREPTCVPLVVDVEGRREHVGVSVGVVC